jgi:NADPH2 dehydrogenase
MQEVDFLEDGKFNELCTGHSHPAPEAKEALKPNRLSPLRLNSKLNLRNRIVVPPMASTTATIDGFVTRRTIEHYSRLAQAGAGLLIAEYSFVHPSGRSEENQLGISMDTHIEGLSQIAEIFHCSHALAGIQLTHGGGKSKRSLTGGVLMAPSAVPVPVKNEPMEVPTPMAPLDIKLWKDAFLAAAGRAAQAGFDLVELHSAHGYGLNQWLSPITNRRQDEYGRDLLGQMRLLLEIVTLIRQEYPTLLISVRMPGQDFFENALTIEDTIQVALALENVGVDLLHISSGIGGWRRPSSRIGMEGYLVAEAAVIQSKVSIPVIGVGGIETAAYIDRVIGEGLISLVAVGRAILKDPKQFAERVLSLEISALGN